MFLIHCLSESKAADTCYQLLQVSIASMHTWITQKAPNMLIGAHCAASLIKIPPPVLLPRTQLVPNIEKLLIFFACVIHIVYMFVMYVYNIHDHHTPPVLLPRTTIFLLSMTENIHLAKLIWPRIPSMDTIEVDLASPLSPLLVEKRLKLWPFVGLMWRRFYNAD